MDSATAAVTQGDLDTLANLFRLLADRTRLNILILLAPGERNVSWLCQTLKLPQPTVSHHLGLLRESGIISNRRSGKQVFYQFDGRVDHPSAGPVTIHTGRFAVSIACTEGALAEGAVAESAAEQGGETEVGDAGEPPVGDATADLQGPRFAVTPSVVDP